MIEGDIIFCMRPCLCVFVCHLSGGATFWTVRTRGINIRNEESALGPGTVGGHWVWAPTLRGPRPSQGSFYLGSIGDLMEQLCGLWDILEVDCLKSRVIIPPTLH